MVRRYLRHWFPQVFVLESSSRKLRIDLNCLRVVSGSQLEFAPCARVTDTWFYDDVSTSVTFSEMKEMHSSFVAYACRYQDSCRFEMTYDIILSFVLIPAQDNVITHVDSGRCLEMLAGARDVTLTQCDHHNAGQRWQWRRKQG